MKGKLFILCFVLLLAASCSTDDYAAPDTDDGQIRFEISFAPFGHPGLDPSHPGLTSCHPGLDPGSPATEHKILSQAQDDIPITRVSTDTQFNSTWQDGDAIGIFAVAHGAPLAATGNPIHNVKLTYSSANSNWTPEEPLYWPAGTGSYDFYAYYPYDAAATDPTQLTFIAKADQSAKDAATGRSHFNLSDLLYARPGNQSSGFTRGQSVSLSFVHAMALVEVRVSKVMLQGDDDPANLAVTLNGCSTTQTLNLADGSLSNQSAPESIRMYPCPNDDGIGTYSYRALVAAGTTVDAGTSLFRFRYREKDLLVSPKLTADLVLTPARAETFSITFPNTPVTVSATERIADLIPEAERAKVTRLSVTGEMTADDFYMIRDNLPNLTALDLSQATVKGDAIPYRALYEKKSLQEFIFPAGITAIGNDAFYYCTGLTGSLTIPEGVETIGDNAFSGCGGFTGTLTIPKSVKTIGHSAFNSCGGLTGTLTIPEGIETIGDGTFFGCGGFTGTLTIPKSVKTIGSKAFSECTDFNGSLTIPEGVTTIGDNAFLRCRGFNSSLTIPKSVTWIGERAFYECSNITSITCHIANPGNVTYGEAGTEVFDRMDAVTAVYVPMAAMDAYKAHPSWSQFAGIIWFIPPAP